MVVVCCLYDVEWVLNEGELVCDEVDVGKDEYGVFVVFFFWYGFVL